MAPVAAFEDRDGDYGIVTKCQGKILGGGDCSFALKRRCVHGQLCAYKYDFGEVQLHQHGELRPSLPRRFTLC